MSSDSHATITYTLMSSYEVIVNGYYGMPMDQLDPYVQLVMEAPPLPDYIPEPEAPPSPDHISRPEALPSPDYIPGPEVPPSPDYIPGSEYPEYLPPADDVLPAKEQLLSAVVSPTAESPGYITESEFEIEPEEEDGDDKQSEKDSIDYLTSRGDNDADDDGDDLLEDDADDKEEEEESSDSKEEKEEHLTLTVPASALYSSVSTSEETEPFEEGETAATPPPFGYLVTARISVQPHILMPFRLESESIPEADIPLRKKARFTTPTGGYEVGESFVAVAVRQIRPALTIADRRRADDRLIGRLRRERRYFLTLSTAYAQEKMAPKRTTRSTQVPPVTPAPTATTTTITESQLQALIDQGVTTAMAEAEASRVRNGYGMVRENESIFNISNCTAACQVKYVACTLQRVGLTWWNSHVKIVTLEVAQALPWKTLKKMMTDKVEKYIGGVPDTIHDIVKAAKPKTMQEAIEFATELIDKRIRDAVGRTLAGPMPQAIVTEIYTQGINLVVPSVITIMKVLAYLDHHYNVEIADGRIIGLNTIMSDCTLNFLNHPFNIDLLTVELGSFDVIVGMDWLSKYDAVIACAEKLVRIPFGNEILT
nr:reverse transcriptase domain-containing protein [Tanacetum cinerariifolium]